MSPQILAMPQNLPAVQECCQRQLVQDRGTALAVRDDCGNGKLESQERQGKGARLAKSVLQQSAIEALGGILGGGIGENCALMGGMRGRKAGKLAKSADSCQNLSENCEKTQILPKGKQNSQQSGNWCLIHINFRGNRGSLDLTVPSARSGRQSDIPVDSICLRFRQ